LSATYGRSMVFSGFFPPGIKTVHHSLTRSSVLWPRKNVVEFIRSNRWQIHWFWRICCSESWSIRYAMYYILRKPNSLYLCTGRETCERATCTIYLNTSKRVFLLNWSNIESNSAKHCCKVQTVWLCNSQKLHSLPSPKEKC
jgi:hypothetical protein